MIRLDSGRHKHDLFNFTWYLVVPKNSDNTGDKSQVYSLCNWCSSTHLFLDRMVPFFPQLVLNLFYHYLVYCFDSSLPITRSIPDYVIVPLKKVKYMLRWKSNSHFQRNNFFLIGKAYASLKALSLRKHELKVVFTNIFAKK